MPDDYWRHVLNHIDDESMRYSEHSDMTALILIQYTRERLYCKIV
jgi:hypothetical protein